MADPLSIDQYIGECLVKCAHVILGSRIFQTEHQRAPSDKRSGRWFKLEVEELASLSARLDPWRRDVYTPLVIEIHIQPWDTSAVMPQAAGSRQHGSGAVGTAHAQGTLLERWTLSYSPVQPRSSTTCSRAAMDSATVYKYLILLIRSLYSFVRVLPAYRMYRACKRHGADLFNTQFTLSTAPLQLQQQDVHSTTAIAAATRPHAAASGSKMCQFHFSPVETVSGQFQVSVEYQPATTVHFLEQTTVLPCAPRIITDYMDAPCAKSAPNSASRLLSRAQSSNAATGRASKAGDGTGAPNFLQPSQQHAPLVRHSWSSKDVAAPIVQRGFSPVARSNSLNAGTSINLVGGMGSSRSSNAPIQQQQQHVSLHHRSFLQGCGSCSAVEAAGTNAAAAAASATTGPAVGGSNSPVLFQGPSSLGRPPLPHSSAFAGQACTGGGAGGHNSVSPSVQYNSGGSVGAGGVASSGLPPASPGTPSGSVRTGTSPLLLRSASAGAAAVSSAAAAAAAAAGAAAGAAAAALTSTSLGSAAAGHLSRLGSSFGSSPLGAPRVLGLGLGGQQRARLKQDIPQATHQGFVVKENTAAGCRAGSSTAQQQQQQQDDGGQEQGAPASDADLLAAAAAAAEQERQQHAKAAAAAAYSATNYATAAVAASSDHLGTFHLAAGLQHYLQQQQQAGDMCVSIHAADTSAAGAAATAAAANLNSRAVSAPVMIPGRGKGKARSVTDLPLMEAEMQLQQQQHLPGQPYQTAAGGAAAGAAGLNPRLATSPWLSQASRTEQLQSTTAAAAAYGASGAAAQPSQNNINGSGACSNAAAGPTADAYGRVPGGLSAAGLLRAGGSLLGAQQGQQRQQQPKQQMVQVPSSAPAAPRGMLGQLLSGQTSPSFSPPGDAAAAPAAVQGGTYSGRVTEAAAGAAVADAAATGGDFCEMATAGAAVTAADNTIDADLPAAVQPAGVSVVRSNAIVIMPASTAAAAAAANVSPSSGSSADAPHSRTPSHQAYQTGLHPPGTTAATALSMPPSIFSSSPQLPFAFTPSAASLGMSLMSLADQHRNFLGSSGPGNMGGVATTRAAAAGTSVGGSGTGTVGSLGRGGGSSIPRSPLGASSTIGSSAAVSRQDSGACAAVSAGVGTPSPPPHVSCVRDITGLATIRRPSWSSRSSSFDVAASASLPHNLSMSPMLGDLLDPALLDCSGSQGSHGTGRPQTLAAAGRGAGGRSNSDSGRGVIMTPAVVLPGGFRSIQQGEVAQPVDSSMAGCQAAAQGYVGDVDDTQREGFVREDAAGASGQCHDAADSADVGNESRSTAAERTAGGADGLATATSGPGGDSQQEFAASALPDESESDILPFALDAETCAVSHVALRQGVAGYSGSGMYQQQQQQHPQQQHGYKLVGFGAGGAGAGGPTVTAAAAAERDVAVGAFMKQIQEAAAAPPFKRSRSQLQQQQVQNGSDGQQPQQQRQHLLVGDAVQQVQQLAARLQVSLFSNSAAGF